MPSRKARLDRFLSRAANIPRRSIRHLLAQKRVMVDGEAATNIHAVVDQFSHITLDGEVLQANTPRYFMLNKPAGVVSATEDPQHKTVLALLPPQHHHNLHIVGRLDFNSTGLLLLTNHGAWSKQLMQPDEKIAKYYTVELENPVSPEQWQIMIETFKRGMYFEFENLTTLPAGLEPLTATSARVELIEGRYHQIKRMFGRFRNKVIGLHRTRVGHIQLDPTLAFGDYRSLTQDEIQNASQ